MDGFYFRDNGQDSGYLRRDKPKKDKSLKSARSSQEKQPTRIVYQFLYNNNSRQLTEVLLYRPASFSTGWRN